MLRAVISHRASLQALSSRRALNSGRKNLGICTKNTGIRKYSQEASAGVPYESYKADEASLTTDAPESADVVIVGGGVIGCSTLYHLTKLGVTNAVLVERDQLTSGTTWHTAGLVWRLRPNDVDIELLSRSHKLMTSLEEETGINTGWINNGGLFISSTKERMDEYKRLHTIGKAFGIESHVLGPEETKKLYPLMNVEDIYATLYSPQDGTIDPAGYCNALTRGATRRGAKVLQKCGVTGVDVGKDEFNVPRVQAVHTDRGTIKTNCVVNACGVWAPTLGTMAGVKVPLVAMKHAYVVTERIEGIQNMPNVRDHDASLYLKLQGDTLQVGGYEPDPIFCDPVKKDFAFSLYDLDWDVFSVHVEVAVNRVPVIENTGVRSTVCGPESFTADHKPLMGESPEVRGFYLACGFNSSGMMLSSCGEQMAKWILEGRPELDMYGYDIRRFTTKLTDNKKWIWDRSHESYAKNYSIVFPHDEPLAARKQRKDALYQELLDAGCVYQERQGWERPGWFSSDGSNEPLDYDYYGSYGNTAHSNHKYKDKLEMDYTFDFPKHHENIGQECLTCRNKVAVFDMSYFGKYYLVGPDAQLAADWLFTNDMRKKAGSTMYTCMLNEKGGTELDLTVSVLEPGNGAPHAPKFEGVGFYLAVGGGAAQHGLSFVQNVLEDKKFNCSLIDHSEDMCLISVQGPHSRDLLQSVCSADFSNEAFPFSTHKEVTIADHSCRALRLSFVGELGWELHVPSTSAVAVYRALMSAGKQYGVVNAGYRAIDSLSIEKGYRHWHADLRSDDTPLESQLGFTCRALDGSQGDFQGRQALQTQKAEGLKKRLVCFTLDKPAALVGLEAIWRNDKVVGFIRRADFAFALNKSIAYGYISRPDGKPVTAKYIKEGSYALEHIGIKHAANVHLKTPFDPLHKRVQGIYTS